MLKRPRLLVLLAFGLLWAASYYVAVGLDHLQAHDPPRIPPNMFDGRFDDVILRFLIPLMIVGAVGTALSALWCLCRLILDLVHYARAKHAA